jgi:small subunit ribosomal protein S9
MSNESMETNEQPTEQPTEQPAVLSTEQPTEQAEAAPAPAAPAAAAPVETAKPARRAVGAKGEQYNGLGRRKTSVARVFLRPGQGRWVINGRTFEDYFPRAVLRQAAAQPFSATDTDGSFDVIVNVNGGGIRGHAEAVRLGVARALLKVDEEFRPRLRAQELLTRDPREVERKKPGRPKARKHFQFSKR